MRLLPLLKLSWVGTLLLLCACPGGVPRGTPYQEPCDASCGCCLQGQCIPKGDVRCEAAAQCDPSPKTVLTIDAVATMPAIWWAYRLYQDPARAGELVARNGVKHPQFMPQQFEALAS